VGEFRQRIWRLFLCVFVGESENSGLPQRLGDTENFRFKFPNQIAGSQNKVSDWDNPFGDGKVARRIISRLNR